MFDMHAYKQSVEKTRAAILAWPSDDDNDSSCSGDAMFLQALQCVYEKTVAELSFNRVTCALVLICIERWGASVVTLKRVRIPPVVVVLAERYMLFECRFLDPYFHESRRMVAGEAWVEIAWELIRNPRWEGDVTQHVAVERLRLIKGSLNEGYVTAKRTSIWLARIFLLVAFPTSIVYVVLLWKDGGNAHVAFSRIIIVLWWSYLLTTFISKDHQFVPNAAIGRKLLKDVQDVMEFTESRDKNVLKSAVMASDVVQPWLHPDGACYALRGAEGKIELSRGITIASVCAAGFYIDGNLIRSRLRQEGYPLILKDDGGARIRINDIRLSYPSLIAPIDAHEISDVEESPTTNREVILWQGSPGHFEV